MKSVMLDDQKFLMILGLPKVPFLGLVMMMMMKYKVDAPFDAI